MLGKSNGLSRHGSKSLLNSQATITVQSVINQVCRVDLLFKGLFDHDMMVYRMLDPTWASWNLGVFVCISCTGAHRSLGPQGSKVQFNVSSGLAQPYLHAL
jgi:hypothetical protein